MLARPEGGKQVRRAVVALLEDFHLAGADDEQALAHVALAHNVLARFVHDAGHAHRLVDVHIDHVAAEEGQQQPVQDHAEFLLPCR